MGRKPKLPTGKAAEGTVLQTDRLIEAVANEMTNGKWLPYRSVRQFAIEQGISLGHAQRYAAAASRLVRMSWNSDEAKVALIERISRLGHASETRTEEVVDSQGCVHEVRKPDMRSALRAAEWLGNVLGISGTNSELVVRVQSMSDGELFSEMQRFIEEMRKTNDSIESIGHELGTEDAEGNEDALAGLELART